MSFNITTTAFELGARFPAQYTGEGDDISPPLKWEDTPKDAASLALILEDPDAPTGTFTHWIVYNLPPKSQELEKITPIAKHLDNGAHQGKNDFGKVGYRGPLPPRGEEHRYYFKLFALRKKLPRESVNSREEFYKSIKDLVIEETSYMGTYRRKK